MRTLLISIFAALTLAACTGSKTTASDETANDSTNVEAAKGDDFVSPDLAFFGLKGPVHTLKTKYSEYVFDEKGTLLTVDGRDPFQGPDRKIHEDGSFEELIGYERNDEGYIVSASTWEGETEFIWDEGQVIREESAGEGMIGMTVYTHNEDGTIAYAAESWRSDDEEEEADVEGECEDNSGDYVAYSDYKKDSHGNWISRTRSYIEEKETETRKITYFGE